MIARRDMLKLAAAVTAATPFAQFAVTPERAAALLNEPAVFISPPGRKGGPVDEIDPVAFAESIDAADWLEFFDHGGAVEMAAYKQAYNRALDTLGILERELPNDHALNQLDEKALTMWCTAWMAGVRAGAQYEHLRLCLVTPRMSCKACYGNGKTWGGRPYRHYDDGTNEAVCTNCSGLGTVATPATTLSFG
ncbi:MAG: hypothetical protein M3354_02170 [Chloroflexota bacterium]|nr:hypothetical protein [Chloroflexota bacterium]